MTRQQALAALDRTLTKVERAIGVAKSSDEPTAKKGTDMGDVLAETTIEAKARELMAKSTTPLSLAQAIDRVYTHEPELYTQDRAEDRFTKAVAHVYVANETYAAAKGTEARIMAKARELVSKSAEPLSQEQAVRRVLEREPALYEAWKAETR